MNSKAGDKVQMALQMDSLIWIIHYYNGLMFMHPQICMHPQMDAIRNLGFGR